MHPLMGIVVADDLCDAVAPHFGDELGSACIGENGGRISLTRSSVAMPSLPRWATAHVIESLEPPEASTKPA